MSHLNRNGCEIEITRHKPEGGINIALCVGLALLAGCMIVLAVAA